MPCPTVVMTFLIIHGLKCKLIHLRGQLKDKLHILNGHSTLYLFKEAKINGDVFVWNEILSEGPVTYQVASEEFWELRRIFVSETFGGEPKAYDELKENFQKLRQFREYREVVLWYEYDLFCQVNLMAVLSWIHGQGHRKTTIVSLICVGNETGYDQLVGLGQIASVKYKGLFEKRIKLSEANLAYADLVWQAYCVADPNELLFATIPHPIFKYLYLAIKAHLQRFSDGSHGFNEIEWEMLSYIDKHQPKNVDDVIRHMLQWQVFYGFGDMQYYYYLKKMETYFMFGTPVTLSKEGKKAIQKGIKRKEVNSLDLSLGGSNARKYHWKDGSLIPIK